ncbi:hypothetical protein NECAME_10776 [Necator americanus]|uniref:Uncharacterized protein n=1 Tax=Necator americanus TaxID=51031 RepID=W2T895_NECAM|nr:hypothetical protein NECAME_10776 [Necator americanus]ETN77824.1 hypothetical protein NECAME_10776 [Necator americanus]
MTQVGPRLTDSGTKGRRGPTQITDVPRNTARARRTRAKSTSGGGLDANKADDLLLQGPFAGGGSKTKSTRSERTRD